LQEVSLWFHIRGVSGGLDCGGLRGKWELKKQKTELDHSSKKFDCEEEESTVGG
jgi:hypothetical protein